MQEHNAKCNKSHNPVAEEKLPFEMFCICNYSDTDGKLIFIFNYWLVFLKCSDFKLTHIKINKCFLNENLDTF